jgi:hypothetical protein
MLCFPYNALLEKPNLHCSASRYYTPNHYIFVSWAYQYPRAPTIVHLTLARAPNLTSYIWQIHETAYSFEFDILHRQPSK